MAKIGPTVDPHMHSPWPRRILIIIIIGILVYFVAPKVVEIYNSNLNDNQTRADNS